MARKLETTRQTEDQMLSTIRDSSIAQMDRLRRTALSFLGGSTVGVRAIVIRGDWKVLLVRHRYQDGWYTPGGGVKPCESPISAMKRELREETGLEAIGTPELLHVFVQSYRGVTDFPIFYLVKSFEGTATIMDPREIAELQWVPLETAPTVTAPKTAAFFAEYLSGAGYRERW